MSENVLTIENATMQFGGVVAVDNLNLKVDKDQIVSLIGPNGAGKTTAFNVVTGVYAPTNGAVWYRGEKIVENYPQGKMRKLYKGEHAGEDTHALAPTPDKITRMGMARTFQNIRLFGSETALENVMVGCQVRRKSQWWMPVFSLPSARREEEEIREKAKGLIHRLALDSYMDEKASSLPYGAQRRLEIARALATSPDFLLLDEPAAGMNPQESTELMRFIRHIRDEFDLTILLIEHDMKVVMGVCQYIWVLEYGQLIAEGDPDAIRNNPRVIEAYLGEDVSNHA